MSPLLTPSCQLLAYELVLAVHDDEHHLFVGVGIAGLTAMLVGVEW
jgi:hypothetical protein